MRAFFIITSGLLLLTAGGCASQSGPEALVFAPSKPQDFSGHWEVDYSRSDSIQTQLNGVVRQIQRDIIERARTAERGQMIVSAGAESNRGRDIIALAEMAELITAPELLEILQSDREVRIRREGSFALVCDLTQPPPVMTTTPLGEEVCGWDGHQLFFQVRLPEGLLIEHRLTRSGTAERLVIQTAVHSPEVSQPFVLNKVFSRYDPDSAGFHCRQTLSRGKVCTTEPRDDAR
jgi:hypothetical protein